MGGRGSGNWWRWDTKDTTADYRQLDIRRWQRQGRLVAGSFYLFWAGGASIKVEVHDLAERFPALPPSRELLLVLEYTYRHAGGAPVDVRQPVFLEWTPCHYGGERPWFRCSADGCGRRVALLYGAGKYFACRRCCRLVYQSQREDEYQRHLTRANAIRRRLGGGSDALGGFPPKPKGMHWRTYDRLLRECAAAERAADAAFWVRLAQLNAMRDRPGLGR
jgi:hypothetical protein